SHDDEIARPDFYRVRTGNGVTAQLSPTDHGGIMQFTFPAGQATGSLVFYNGTFNTAPDGTVTGWVDNGSGLSVGGSRMFVAGAFDRAPTAGKGTLATFDTRGGTPGTPAIPTSFNTLEQARKNLALEVTGRSFEQLHAAATAAWNDRLGRVE